MRFFFAAVLLTLSVSSFSSQIDYQEGREYKTLPVPMFGHSSEVIFFFNYASSYSFRFNAVASELKQRLPEGVTLNYVPVFLNIKRFEGPGILALAAEELKINEQYRDYFFKVVQAPVPWEGKKYKRFLSEESIMAFFSDAGFKDKEINLALKSAYDQKLEVEQMEDDLNISNPITFLVKGKYIVSGMAPHPFSENEIIDLIAHLANK